MVEVLSFGRHRLPFQGVFGEEGSTQEEGRGPMNFLPDATFSSFPDGTTNAVFLQSSLSSHLVVSLIGRDHPRTARLFSSFPPTALVITYTHPVIVFFFAAL